MNAKEFSNFKCNWCEGTGWDNSYLCYICEGDGFFLARHEHEAREYYHRRLEKIEEKAYNFNYRDFYHGKENQE